MRIAITGGSGFIGRWLARAARQAGHEVCIVGRAPGRRRFTFGPDEFPYASSDYSAASLAPAVKGCDGVAHLAAARFGGLDRFEAYQENVRLSWNVLEACRLQDVPVVAMLSSIAVYSSGNPCPWSEEQAPIPLNLYGASKLAAEALAAVQGKARGLNVKCLRVAQVMGWGEPKRNAWSAFIELARARAPLPIRGGGAERREYVYVKDVTEALLLALSPEAPPGIYNVGQGAALPIRELALAINRVFDNPSGLLSEPAQDSTPFEGWMDIGKADRCLKWRPHWEVEDALMDMRRSLDANDLEVTYG